MAKVKRSLRVVILDDEEGVEDAIRSRLPKGLAKNATVVPPDSIADLTNELGRRIAAARKDTGSVKDTDTIIDMADLFIVDYDLIRAKGEDYLTGEHIAYLARCYSRCGVVVGLNQFHRSPTFDLTLRPQLDSFADFNVSTDDLKNSGLWTDGPWKGYRPWAWPVLPTFVELMRQRVRDVESVDTTTCVVEFLEFPRSAIERLPTSSLELLGGSGSKPESATLRDVLLAPVLGLRGKEASRRKLSPSQDARIIAARLSAWLNMILAPQDVLVDAPHLAERCPSTVGSKVTITALSKTTIQQGQQFAGLKNKDLSKTRLRKTFWYDRPVWFWTEIERNRLLPELKDPWKFTRSDYVFCEDSSSFKKRSAGKSFQSDLLSPYRTRYVGSITGVDYQPAHRLALS
jgi:hypothetical protein